MARDPFFKGDGLESPIGKKVGKRVAPAPLKLAGANSTEEAKAWHKAFSAPCIPRGVYRFKTHEEADEWLWKMITRRKKT